MRLIIWRKKKHVKKDNKTTLTSPPACLGHAWLHSRTPVMHHIFIFFFFWKINFCEVFIDLVSLILLPSFGDCTVGMIQVNRQFGHSQKGAVPKHY